jgi:hypothetical protein
MKPNRGIRPQSKDLDAERTSASRQPDSLKATESAFVAERRAYRDPSYKPGRTAEGMRMLADKFGHHFQDINDVGAYVQQLRTD